MLEVRNLCKSFGNHLVLKDVSFDIRNEEFVCLLGESGSGKSTIAELLMGLNKPTQGEISWTSDKKNGMQYIYQNPDRSFNPFWTMKQSLMEPLLLKKHPKKDALEKITAMMDKAGLPLELLKKKPSQCSGGQKQRMGIIRALLCNPSLLIADEITSALDPQTEQMIIHFLKELQSSYQMSVLYITHRIQAIEDVADRVLILENGCIVESGQTKEVLQKPKHPYTKRLLDACLYFEKRKKKKVV
jgi:peptide/nickel transport system ATP-binding protein